MSGEALVVVALALRACVGPLCCWEVRLDDGTLYRGQQGADASFEIPRQGRYFETRAAPGRCTNPGGWSDWSRFAWLHPADVDADGVVALTDFGAMSSELGQTPAAADYFYCLQAEPAEP